MSLKNSILSKSNQFNYYKDKTSQLKKENKKLKGEINELSPDLEKGISIVIPSYKGENHIHPILDSLEKQTLSKDLFELIFVVNGEMDSTMDILLNWVKSNQDMNIVLTYTNEAGVCNARNIGIRIAKREYIGFLDDDDFISEKYLEALYNHIGPNRVVMSNFIDIDEEILPAMAVKGTDFNPNLNNGVDVSYYARLYPKHHFEFYFVDKSEEAIYYRIRRSGSISRQEYSFQFNVLDRLKVMDDINKSYLSVKKSDKAYKKFLRILMRGQSTFMQKYLKEFPEERERVIEEVKKHNFEYFPYERIEE